MSVNTSRNVIIDGVRADSIVGLDKYNSSKDLAAVLLFEDYPDYLRHFAFSIFIIFIIIGIPGNLLTIFALARYKKVRNAAAIFIINVSVSDLIISSAVVPVTAFVILFKSWVFGKIICRIYPLLSYSFSTITLLSIVAVTINRYILIVYPQIYRRCYNKKSIVIMILAIWTFSFAILIPTLFEAWGRFSLNTQIGFCAMIPDDNGRSPKKFIIITLFMIPCLIMFVCYIHIFLVVKRIVKKSGPKTNKMIDVKHHDELSTGSSSNKNDTETTDIQQDTQEEPNYESNSEGPSNENGLNLERLNKNNMSKKVRKHLRTKLKEISKKQWLPTRKDKKLRTMIMAIMISFCVCHVPMLLIKTLYSEFSSYPTLVFTGYLLMTSTICINPIIYVVMSSEYREAYKSLFKSIFRKR